MIRKLTIFAAVLASFAAPASAVAQRVCTDRNDVIRHLDKKFGEGTVAVGLATNGAILEVLASKNGTWTIILTQHSGTSCIVASGEAWSAATPRVGTSS